LTYQCLSHVGESTDELSASINTMK